MYAIGSSYLIRQTPGGEQFGGLTVTIRPRRSSTSQLDIQLTDWKTNKPIEENIGYLANEAFKGLQAFAEEHHIDLENFSITLSKFAYHPVDSAAKTFRKAGYLAFAAAWQTWHMNDITSPIE